MSFILLIPWITSLLFSYPSGIPEQTLGHLDNKKLEIIQFAYNKAVENGVSPDKFVRLINCESRLEKKAKGDWSEGKKEHLSKGILQFQKPTFNKFSKIYGLKGKYLDPYDQIELAVLMIQGGGWKHWFNCSIYSTLNKDYE